MGFIDSGTTVTVQAKLTDAGKKKLYESIESNSSGFITKFAIGDSDANYKAIDAGGDTLATGHVPEASGFKPTMRSFVLHQGTYRPAVPVVLVGGEYGSDNGITTSLSIGGNKQVQISLEPTTEWPKNEPFEETYKMEVQNPGNLSESQLNRFFTVVSSSIVGNVFQFNGGLNISELAMLLGAYGQNVGNETIVPVKVIGTITNATVMYNIRLIK